MAEQASDYHRGDMEIDEQVATYNVMMGLTKWGSLAVAALVLMLTLWFCTDSGFLGAVVGAGAFTVIGFFFLRTKKSVH
ncbi:aa3-type cytochrome c oxidase subunit IV [Phenylobacterium deserti]|uniref:Aa3-type cytochrome c oxidase subunit IV n=1 Tax=Phenylobacterium deserti TaxID=1914756 RepID=A0A328APP8_9CAUL|nr:aa3-type cytochrome c oxidase subunit IV [Phenylobacterium deserti]RAK56983.1 aa3-type cytochrome c oxidase subunit IV [Phenylobacterium deserti]